MCLIDLIYVYKCSMCDKEIEEKHSVRLHGEILRPHAPAGWHTIDNQLVCDRHQISLHEVGRLDDKYGLKADKGKARKTDAEAD